MPSQNKTAHLKLNQWNSNEYPKMDDFVADNLVIDQAIKSLTDNKLDKDDFLDTIVKSTGTSTALVLTMPYVKSYANMMQVTFVASAANGGAATTININSLGVKPLYKPNTTSSPNTVAGKAYTVWYDASQNCFFVKASAEGDVTTAQVLAGQTFSNDDDTGLIGTMPNRGSVGTVNLTSEGATYTIQAGYHNGLGKVKALISGLVASVIKAGTTVGGIVGTFTADATAAAGHVLSGKTAYKNGNKITGTMPNRGTINKSLSINGTYTIPSGYHSGSGKVTQSVATKAAQTYTPSRSNQTIPAGRYLTGNQIIAGDADLVSANIKAGANIFGVAGNSNVVDTSAGTAAASHILSGYKAYVDGALRTGTMPNRGGATTVTPSKSNQTKYAGYYSGNITIVGDPDLIPANIIAGKNIFGVVGVASHIHRIQRGIASFADSHVADIAISPVDRSRAILITNLFPGADAACGEFISNASIRLYYKKGVYKMPWQVIEFNHVKSLQYGKARYPLSTNRTTITINRVNMAKTMVIGVSTYRWQPIAHYLTSPTALVAELNESPITSDSANHLWYVVEFY